jgi:cytochrome c biogenesis protein CcmG/thiol:disulfide interchange protein DsbE
MSETIFTGLRTGFRARFLWRAAAPTGAIALAACAGAMPDAGPSAERSPLVGNPAPGFTATAIGSNETLSLKKLRGHVVLVDFWGTFCEPCKKSFPKLQALSSRYFDRGFRAVGISEDEPDDRDKIPGFAESYGVKFALAWDGDRSIARAYGPETMPSTFVIDKQGLVRYVHVGFHEGEEVELDREVHELLGP